MATRLRKLKITAVALVDRGANYDPATGEGAHVLLYKREEPARDDWDEGKRDYSSDAREAMATRGHAMAGGRYPIATVQDLRNAIRAFGRGAPEDKPAIRRHIIRRARALGHADLLPEDWGVSKADEGGVVKEDGEYEVSMPDDIILAREARDAYYRAHDAFMESFQQIMHCMPPAEQPALLQTAVTQFGGQLKGVFPTVRKDLGGVGESVCDALEGLLHVAESAPASDQRITRVREAADALEGVLKASDDETPATDGGEGGEEMAGITQDQYDGMEQRAKTAELLVTTLQGQMSQQGEQIASLTAQVEKAEAAMVEATATMTALTTEVETFKSTATKQARDTSDPEQFWKGASPEQRAAFEAIQKEAKDNAELAQIEKDRRERQEYIAQVRKFDPLPMHPDDDWETLRDIDRHMPDKSRERVLSLFRVGAEWAKRGKATKVIGVDGRSELGEETAQAQITKLAQGMITKGEAKSFTEALTLINQQNPLLYQEYRDEQRTLARKNFVEDDV